MNGTLETSDPMSEEQQQPAFFGPCDLETELNDCENAAKSLFQLDHILDEMLFCWDTPSHGTTIHQTLDPWQFSDDNSILAHPQGPECRNQTPNEDFPSNTPARESVTGYTASATSDELTRAADRMALCNQESPVQSPESGDKRRRNAEASRRFRDKQRLKMEGLQRRIQELKEIIRCKEERQRHLESENLALRLDLCGSGSAGGPKLPDSSGIDSPICVDGG